MKAPLPIPSLLDRLSGRLNARRARPASSEQIIAHSGGALFRSVETPADGQAANRQAAEADKK